MPSSKTIYTSNPWRGVASLQDDAGLDAEAPATKALQKRYGTKDWKAISDAYAKELGIGDYKIPVARQDLNPYESVAKFHYGEFDPGTRAITIDERIPGVARPATMAHELAHAADYIYGEAPTEERGPGTHHKAFASFDEELPILLNAQAEREMGLPLPDEVSRRYPFMGKLNPLSSNKLPHPWTTLPNTFPVDIWNALYSANQKEPAQ